MRIVCTSDTHMSHPAVRISECDVLVHAGDFTRRGSRAETIEFLDWLAEQPATHKLLVAGNHDWAAETHAAWFDEQARARSVTVLMDSEVAIDGVRFWGSPVTPRFRDMAFNRDRGAAIRRHWQKIPQGVDVLVTHGPPRGIGDRMFLGAHVGCEDLREELSRVRPRLHVFGHIHEAFGEHAASELPTQFLNVACARWLSYGRRDAVSLDL